MLEEQDKTLKALKIAIRMEVEGQQFYGKASRSSDNQLGRKLFESLAVEEGYHRQKFEEIYEAIRSKKAWPETDFQPDKGKRLRTIFAEATEAIGLSVKAPATELDAIQMAMEMENKSYDFYKNQGRNALYYTQKDFYEALANEERQHHLVLLDYHEFLSDPAGWFVGKEHPSLDGG